MAVFNSAEAVPTFFFFAVLPCLLSRADGQRNTDCVDLRFMGLAVHRTSRAPLWHAQVHVPMPDVPALLFSLSGLFLVLLFSIGEPDLSRCASDCSF